MCKTENNLSDMTGALEAVLFAAGEPLEIDKIAGVLEIGEDEVISLYERLCADYDAKGSGITVLRLKDKLQMCTKKEYFDVVRAALELRRNAPLSQAAFEVLAVIAYNQPVTKSFIEQVRGVDCSGVVSSLCEKGLIEEQGRLDLPGRPLLYGTTDTFMRCFGLSSLEALPPIPHNDEENSGDDDNSQLSRDDTAAGDDADTNDTANNTVSDDDTADNPQNIDIAEKED